MVDACAAGTSRTPTAPASMHSGSSVRLSKHRLLAGGPASAVSTPSVLQNVVTSSLAAGSSPAMGTVTRVGERVWVAIHRADRQLAAFTTAQPGSAAAIRRSTGRSSQAAAMGE